MILKLLIFLCATRGEGMRKTVTCLWMTHLIGLFDFAKGSKGSVLEERESRPELQEAKLEQVVFMVMEWNF